jgi:hypothetical protein
MHAIGPCKIRDLRGGIERVVEHHQANGGDALNWLTSKHQSNSIGVSSYYYQCVMPCGIKGTSHYDHWVKMTLNKPPFEMTR